MGAHSKWIDENKDHGKLWGVWIKTESLNDKLGCKIGYKQNETISLIPLFSQVNGKGKQAHSKKEEKCSTFSLKCFRTLSRDLWSSCFILNINFEQEMISHLVGFYMV